jgi:molybdate transport system substrate-binding protein
MPLRVISSMATRRLLQELIDQFQSSHSTRVALESVGGVDAARRVRAGEDVDVVVLAKDAIEDLIASGRLLFDGQVDVVRSAVAVAVRSGEAHPDISSAEALQRAVLAARTIGYSTGPSGVQLARLFADWGIAETVKDRITVAPPGVPVATLVARGDVALGFQQLSELIGVEGIDVIGTLPPAIAITTTFSGAIARATADAERAGALLQFLAAPAAADVKRRHGMEPAPGP